MHWVQHSGPWHVAIGIGHALNGCGADGGLFDLLVSHFIEGCSVGDVNQVEGPYQVTPRNGASGDQAPLPIDWISWASPVQPGTGMGNVVGDGDVLRTIFHGMREAPWLLWDGAIPLVLHFLCWMGSWAWWGCLRGCEQVPGNPPDELIWAALAAYSQRQDVQIRAM